MIDVFWLMVARGFQSHGLRALALDVGLGHRPDSVGALSVFVRSIRVGGLRFWLTGAYSGAVLVRFRACLGLLV